MAHVRAEAAIGISPAAEAGVYALWLIALLGILAWQKWALYLYLALLALEGISAVGMFLLEMGAYSQPTEGTLVSLIRFPLHLLATFIFLFPLRKQM